MWYRIGSTGVVAGDFEGEVSQNVALEGVGGVGVVSRRGRDGWYDEVRLR